MISNTGPTRKRSRSDRAPAGPADGRRDGAPAGFTLLEIVLVLALVAMLTGIAAVGVSSLRRGRVLGEGARRFETALRMARADAANRGRRLRLIFDAETTRPAVLWEPDPLESPGEFVDYARRCTWHHLLPDEGLRVERCEFTGASAYRYVADAGRAGGVRTESDLPAITFEPDGSSDSFLLHLVAADDREGSLARIEVNGLTGTVTTRILTPEELAELEAEEEAGAE